MNENQEFKPIESQEQFNSMTQARIDREAKKYTEKISDLESENKDLKKQVEELNSRVNESNTTIEDMKSQIQEKDDKIQVFTVDQMKYDIAYDYGIPRNFTSRLQGSTYEEIEADAKEMAKTFENMRPDPPTRSNEPQNVLSGLDAGYAAMAENLTKGD